MLRNGRAQSLFQRYFCASDLWFVKNTQRNLLSLRYYATDDGKKGKGGKGTTAKVEECIPGSSKKIPAASMKPCPPPKIKIPSSAPVKPPPQVCCYPPKPDVCDQQPCYDPCQPGGVKNPVMQGCKKPNMMHECIKPKEPPVCEDPDKARKRYIRNIILTLLLFSLLTWGILKYFQKEDVVPTESPKRCKKKRRKRLVCKDPKTGMEIPSEVPYLLIGGGTAAFSAFRSIKSLDPTAQVLVVSSEDEFPYMRPPLSKEMWFNDDQESMEKLQFKQWNGTIRSIYYEPESFYMNPRTITSLSKGGIAIAKGWTVTKIEPYKRKAILDDGTVINYKKCLIATGSTPKTLPAFDRADECVKEYVQTYRDVFDFQDLNDMVQESEAIAIVGGGFLGSELACALARHGKKKDLKVYQIFKEPGNMGKVLPEYLSLWTTEKVKAEGVEVISDTQVLDAKVAENKLKISLSNGKKIMVDYAVVAVGAKPNTSLAEVSELETHSELGGYLVNAELEARTDLYVAGDAACFYDVKLGRRRIEHHDHAVVSGRLAGENMTGAAKPYWHQSMFWSDLGPEVGYEAIGIIDSKLPTVGVFAKKTDKDTPEAVVAATDSSIRSQTEEAAAPVPPSKGSPKPPTPGEDFGKGVIFYLKDDIVVGIVMWNVFNRMQIARQVLKEERKYDDLNEVAKLFNIHEE